MTYWHGSGSGFGFADPYRWLTDQDLDLDLDPAPDPAFSSVADRGPTKISCLKVYLHTFYFLKVHLHQSSKINFKEKSQKSGYQCFSYFFACWWKEPDPYNKDRFGRPKNIQILHCLKLTMATISKRKQTKASIMCFFDIEGKPNVEFNLNGLLLTCDMPDSKLPLYVIGLHGPVLYVKNFRGHIKSKLVGMEGWDSLLLIAPTVPCAPPPLHFRLWSALQRTNTENSKHIFPEKELRPISTFMCLWAISIFPQSICLFCCRKICGPILRIYKSLTDTWMWKLGLGAQFPERIHKWDFRCSVEQPMIVTISFEILKQTASASHPTQSAPQVSESLW